MAIEIITDSTSDLTAQEARERNVHLIPMRVIFEDGVYQDGVDLDKETFYTKQAEAKILPKTTQLNPQDIRAGIYTKNRTHEQILYILRRLLR